METACQRSVLDYETTVSKYDEYNDDKSIEANKEEDDNDDSDGEEGLL